MSLSSFARGRLRRSAQTDDGFTLIEVMAALVVFAIVAAMALAMLLSAIRGGLVAKQDTVGRNLTQAKIEELRNLPFHIDQAVSTEYDLLDLYYPNASGTGAAVGTTGYVPASGTGATVRDTTKGDPSSGAFFRTLISAVPNFSGYSQYVTVQFVNTSGTAVAPPSGYTALTAGSDTPVTNAVNINVTTVWKVGKSAKSYSIFSSIGGGRPAVPKVSVQGHVGGLAVTGLMADGQQATLDLANVDYNASFSNIVTAAATALGGRAKIESASSITGALSSVNAPPNAGPLSAAGGDQGPLQYNGDPFAQFASTDTANVSAGSASGQPYAGSSSAPITADLLSTGSGQTAALYSNQPSNSHLGLTNSSYVVKVLDAATGSTPAMSASGYGNSATTSTSHTATSKITGLTSTTIELFPTTQAPNGVIQITLSSASLSCITSANFGSASTASSAVAYSASLRYATWNGSGITYSSWISLSQSNTSDPLPAGASLATIQVGVDSGGAPIYLGDYIASWSSLTSSQVGVAPAVQQSSDNKSISANYSGLITINTQPVRSGDQSSGVGVTVGSLSCLAVDYR